VRVHRAIARLRSRLSRVGAAGALLPTLTPIAPPPALAGTCLSLLHVPTTSAVSTTALTGGLTLMTKFALAAATLVVAGSLVLPFARAGAEEHHDGDKPKAEAAHAGDKADKPKEATKSDYTEGQKGTAVGTVAETKVEKAAVVIVTEAGQRMRFIAQWVGGMPKDGGGPDKAMVEQIAKLHVGDKVSIDWLFQEHLRVVGIKVLEEKH
jgi:hypothetical protein